MSPSLRGRGLKSFCHDFKCCIPYVALFTRAWIEIITGTFGNYSAVVALFTRAWIEICNGAIGLKGGVMSPSLRGRGLKYKVK